MHDRQELPGHRVRPSAEWKRRRYVDDLERIGQCATEAELENLVTYLPLK